VGHKPTATAAFVSVPGRGGAEGLSLYTFRIFTMPLPGPRVSFGPSGPPSSSLGPGDLEDLPQGTLPLQGTLLTEMKAHTGPVFAVRFTASGNYCLSCGRDRTIRLWNPHRGLHIKCYNAHSHEVRSVDATADHARFASCGVDRQLFFWDVATGRTIRRFEGHNHPANVCRFAASDYLIVSGGDDKAIKLWDTRAHSFQPVQHMAPFHDSVTSVAIPRGRPEIIGSSVDGTLRVFDVRRGLVTVDELGVPLVAVDAEGASSTVGGSGVLVAGLDSTVRLVDRPTGSLLQSFQGHVHTSVKLDCAWLPGDRYATCGSEDGRVVVWDIVSGEPKLEWKAHDHGAVCAMDVRRGGHDDDDLGREAQPLWTGETAKMITSSTDGSIRLWT